MNTTTTTDTAAAAAATGASARRSGGGRDEVNVIMIICTAVCALLGAAFLLVVMAWLAIKAVDEFFRAALCIDEYAEFRKFVYQRTVKRERDRQAEEADAVTNAGSTMDSERNLSNP
jgi:hypothetical protein